MERYIPMNVDEVKALDIKGLFDRLWFLMLRQNDVCNCEGGKLCMNCEILEIYGELKQRWERE